MKKSLLALLLSMGTGFAFGQLVNDGATITIQSGATLFVESNVTNMGTGSITVQNGGTLEVQGNLTNSATGTLSTVGTGKVKFSGTAASSLTSAGDPIGNLEIAKTGAGVVNLSDPASVTTNLNFVSNNLNIGANDLTLATAATATGATATSHIITPLAGKVIKTALTNFTYPVSFDAATYNPITITQSTTDNIGVRVLQNAYKDGPAATMSFTNGVVNASWDVTSSGGASVLDLTPQWAASDELPGFKRPESAVSKYVGPNYDAILANLGAAAGSDPYTRSRTGATAGLYVVGSDEVLTYLAIDAKMNLSSYSATSGLMGDALRSNNLLPLKEPYKTYDPDGNGTPNFIHVGRANTVRDSVLLYSDFDKTGTNDDVVDWVFVQVRNTTAPYGVVATRSALLQRDGDVVGVDGNPVRILGVAPGTYKVALRHRNHLGVMTNANKSLSSTATLIDFTNATTPETPLPDLTKLVLVSGTTPEYALRGGDANASGTTNAIDRNSFFLIYNGVTMTLPAQYLTAGTADYNLSRVVNAIDDNNFWLPNSGITQGFNNN
ncbi:MAG: hypothetical protein RLZZ546_1273 [Bacteroidota bacterium]|jgi:hypothetical protein